MFTTILFDFYGVFQTDPYVAWLKRNGLKRTGEYDSLAATLDSGEIDRHKFIAELSKLSSLSVAYNDIYGGPVVIDSEVVSIAKKLSAHYKLGILSNASTKLRDKVHSLELDGIFDSIVISAEIGKAKPDPEAFHIALQQLKSSPSETVMIDDNPRYVAMSKSLGMEGILFTSADELKRQLASLKILSSDNP